MHVKEKNSVCKVWYYLWFQASTGVPDTHPLWTKGGYSTLVLFILSSNMVFWKGSLRNHPLYVLSVYMHILLHTCVCIHTHLN